jgi:Acyclic terpene utilisation family protein AtuA
MTTTAAAQRTAEFETGKTSRIYAPLGMLGYGFPESSLEAALEWGPDLIAVDAGSTDPGPYYLGAGVSYTSRAMVKRDLGLLLVPAVKRGIPLVVGSAGGAGAAPHLAWCLEILHEIVREHNLHFRLAIIEADQDKAFLKRKLAAGDIRDLDTGRELTDSDIDACSYIVGQMGYEPVIAALRAGADVVLAGRAFDAALSATLPIMRGVEPGLALHMGKIVECGSLVALPRTVDGVLAEIDPEQFTVLPANPAQHCTVETVSAHTMYEKADPYKLAAPGGYIDLSEASFERVDDRSVKVAGSVFVPSSEYWIKLEGSALVGYRSVCLAGVRDPILISQLNDVLERVRLKLRNELAYAPDQYQLLFRVYGRDAVMGDIEPYAGPPAHELGLVLEVIADTQKIADTVCALTRSASLHLGYEGRIATSGNLAFPYSPAEFPAPPVYEFRIYHLVRVDDPCELFRTRWESL